LSGHIVNYITKPKLASDNTIHVIGVISNAARWHSRYRLFRIWVNEMLRTPGVKLYVVEGVYGDHQGECRPHGDQDYQYMQVRLGSEIWLKENMMDVGINNMFPSDWKYMGAFDCDVHFCNDDWVQGALNAMQTYHVIQPWSHGIALDANGGVKSVDTSFGYLRATGQKMSWGRHKEKDGYHYAHTGYAWCYTRYFWENVRRKFIDFCLIGSGDHHMAWSCIGMASDTIHGSMSKGYFQAVYDWQDGAMYACGQRVGYAHGRLEHAFHGPTSGRNYTGRWKILVDNKYDPRTDIAYDAQGIIYLCGSNKNAIEGSLIRYNRGRNEDSLEL
jgi:hypothetical protein